MIAGFDLFVVVVLTGAASLGVFLLGFYIGRETK